jgi:hypothetical protein
MQISGVSLTLTWPPQALFTQSSPVFEPLLQAFPFPSTLGEVTLHPLSLACVFVYSSRRMWVFPPILWSFPPTAAFTSFPTPACWHVLLLLPASMFVYSSRGRWVFPPLLWSFPPFHDSHKLSHSWLLGGRPCSHQSLSGQAQLVYLQFRERFPCLPLWSSVSPTLLQCVFIALLAYYSVSLFPWVEVGLSRGLC